MHAIFFRQRSLASLGLWGWEVGGGEGGGGSTCSFLGISVAVVAYRNSSGNIFFLRFCLTLMFF